MPELYNTSFMDSVTNPVDIFVNIGQTIGNDYLIGNLILLTFFLVILIMAIREDFRVVLVIDAFVTTIVAILLFFADMISAVTIIYPAIIFFIALIFYLFS